MAEAIGDVFPRPTPQYCIYLNKPATYQKPMSIFFLELYKLGLTQLQDAAEITIETSAANPGENCYKMGDDSPPCLFESISKRRTGYRRLTLFNEYICRFVFFMQRNRASVKKRKNETDELLLDILPDLGKTTRDKQKHKGLRFGKYVFILLTSKILYWQVKF
jgi:hypothetical protein